MLSNPNAFFSAAHKNYLAGADIARLNLALDTLWAKSKKGFRDMYADWTYWLGYYYADLRKVFDKDFDENAMKWAMYHETQGSKEDANKAYLDDLKAAEDEYNRRSEAINKEFTDNLTKTLEDGNRRQEEINSRFLRRMEALKKDIEEARRQLESEITPEESASGDQAAADRVKAARERLDKAQIALQENRDRRGMEGAIDGLSPKEKDQAMRQQRLREKEAQLEYNAAQQELRDAVAAKRAAQQPIKPQPRAGTPAAEKVLPSTFMDFMASKLGMEAPRLSYDKASAVGEFSGFARFGMQGSSAAERTANAVEEIAKNTKDLLDETRNNLDSEDTV